MQIQGNGITAKRVHNPDNDSCVGCVFYKQLFGRAYCKRQHGGALDQAAEAAEALAGGTDCKSHNYIWLRVE